MQRSVRFLMLVIVTGISVCIGLTSPSQAQSRTVGVKGGLDEKLPMDGKSMPGVSIQSIQIIRPDPKLVNMPGHMRNMRQFGFPSAPRDGTTLTLSIDEPIQWIISLESKNSKITKFCDDKGTDLAKTAEHVEQGNLPFNPQRDPTNCTLESEVDPTGHIATLTVHSPHLPAGGANRLSLEADIVMNLGKGEKIIEQKNVNLKVDTITVAQSPIVVMTSEPVEGMGQDNGTQVLLFHQGSIGREIRKVSFIDADGKEIQTRGSGSGSSGSVQQLSFNLTKKVENCTVRLTVPESIETVTLSISIDTGVGFPPGARRRTLTTPQLRGKVSTPAVR
jgi:hypothetical protein